MNKIRSAAEHRRRHFKKGPFTKICPYNENQWGPVLFWLSFTTYSSIIWTKTVKAFFRTSSFVFCRRKQLIQAWNDVKVFSFLDKLFLYEQWVSSITLPCQRTTYIVYLPFTFTFTHSHVVLNLNDVLTTVEHTIIYFTEGLFFVCLSNKVLCCFGPQWITLYGQKQLNISSKKLILCSSIERKSYRFGMTRWRFHFWMNCPFKNKERLPLLYHGNIQYLAFYFLIYSSSCCSKIKNHSHFCGRQNKITECFRVCLLFFIYWNSTSPVWFWTPLTFIIWAKTAETFHKITSFVFCRRKKVIQVWNDKLVFSFLDELFL